VGVSTQRGDKASDRAGAGADALLRGPKLAIADSPPDSKLSKGLANPKTTVLSLIATLRATRLAPSTIADVDAVAVASVAGGFSGVLALGLAVAQWGRQRSVRAAEQATLISTQLDPSSTALTPCVRVRNDSRSLVTAVWLRIPGDGTPAHFISSIAPHDYVQVTVAPREEVPSPGWFVMNVGCGGPASATEPRCDLRFKDFRGKNWVRIGTGKPRRFRNSEKAPTGARAVSS
jgi:hypothetical protein